MAKNQFSPKSAKAATTQSSNDATSCLFEQLAGLTDDQLEALEQIIGEMLRARNARPVIQWPERTRAQFARSVSHVREAMTENAFCTTRAPAALEADCNWVKSSRAQIKRAVHRMAPADVISLAMFVEWAQVTPVDDAHHKAALARNAQTLAMLRRRKELRPA